MRKERDRLRAADSANPEIERLTSVINSRVWEEKRSHWHFIWQAHVNSSDRRTAPQKHWRLLCGLEGKTVNSSPNQRLRGESFLPTKPSQIDLDLSIWKSALVIPILKPGKSASKGPSYLPVSLLCPAVKILERLLLPSLKEHLSPASHQHSFQQHHSTTSALLPLVSRIADGMKQPKPPRRSAVVAISIAQAFDRVPIPRLLDEISLSTLHPNIIRWHSGSTSGLRLPVISLSLPPE